MTNRSGFKILMVLLLSLQAFASPIEVGRWVTARNAAESAGVLDSVGQLAPGSVVKIPDDVVEQFQQGDEQALNGWLAQNGELRLFSQNGEVKKDYFFPVEVVDAKNSRGVRAGDKVYVSLRFLSRHQALKLVVDSDAPTVAATEWTTKDRVFRKLKAQLARPLRKVDAKFERNVTNRHSARRGVVRFNSACPLPFEEFETQLERVSQSQRVPAELLLGVMHLESGARCHLHRAETDGSMSIGLFQINTKTSSIPLCDAEQLGEIKVAKTAKILMDARLRCLENPIVNLEEAAHILRAKYSSVNSRKQPPTGDWENLANDERDSWRLALAAYNGGEAYVYQAFFDIQDYNQRHGTSLNPDDWETRRVFFLRQVLDRNTQRKTFSREMRYKRSLQNVMINMAYVESIVGRENDLTTKVTPLIAQWIERSDEAEFASTEVPARL